MSNRHTAVISRRDVVRTIGAVAVGVGITKSGRAETVSATERRLVGTESAAVRERVRAQATNVVREIPLDGGHAVVVGEFPTDTVVELEADSGVRYVEAEGSVGVLGHEVDVPTVEMDLDEQMKPWGITQIGADSVHTEGDTGSGVDIAIIDTGIDSDHPDLQKNLGEGKAVISVDGDQRREWDDDHDHGTHCAGIAGAITNDVGVFGVCPTITLHAVKAISASGNGDVSTLAAGLRWATDQGFDVASLSLGSTSPSETMRDAVRYAADNGVVVVAAAGNEDPDEQTVHYPAAYPEVIAVGATDDGDDLAEFSLTGDAVELVAPGVRIPSTTIGDYKYFSGTSMATPHVAGAAALLAGAGYAPSEIRTRLTESAADIGLDNDEQGNGRLDVQAAFSGATGDDGDSGQTGLSVTTDGATAVEQTSVVLNGTLDGLGEQSSATVGFEYWVAGESDSTPRTVEVGDRSASGEFNATLTDLSSGTTYVYRAVGTTDEERATGRQADVTTEATPSDLFAVETGPAADIEDDEAELVGRVTDLSGIEELAVWFEYWPAGDDGAVRRTDRDEVDEAEQFDEDAEELDPGIAYTYVACGRADGVERRGEEREFTTVGGDGGNQSQSEFVVETSPPTDIDDDEAELVGRVTDLSGIEELAVWFEYWPAGDDGAVRRTDRDEVDETEQFDEDAEELEPDTAYVAVAVGSTDQQSVRGSPVEFRTPSED